MSIHNKFLTIIIAFGLLQGSSHSLVDDVVIHDIVFQDNSDDIAADFFAFDGEPFDIDDIPEDLLRSFEPQEMSFSEKVEVVMFFLNLKARTCKEKLLRHWETYKNVYMLGAVCAGAVSLNCLVKKQTQDS